MIAILLVKLLIYPTVIMDLRRAVLACMYNPIAQHRWDKADVALDHLEKSKMLNDSVEKS